MSLIVDMSERRGVSKKVMDGVIDTRLTSRQIQTIDGLVHVSASKKDTYAPIRADGMAVGAPTTATPAAVMKGLNPKTKRKPGMIYPIQQN